MPDLFVQDAAQRRACMFNLPGGGGGEKGKRETTVGSFLGAPQAAQRRPGDCGNVGVLVNGRKVGLALDAVLPQTKQQMVAKRPWSRPIQLHGIDEPTALDVREFRRKNQVRDAGKSV